MQTHRLLFGAGPVPNLHKRLFVGFVQPGRAGADIFYGDSPADVVAKVQTAYAGDRLTLLPPLGKPDPDLILGNETADIVVADLAELVSAKAFSGITDNVVVRRLCRAGLEFMQGNFSRKDTLLVAEIHGSSIIHAEVVLECQGVSAPGFTLYPGRGTLAQMRLTRVGAFPLNGMLALVMRGLPEWAAPSACFAYGNAVVPDPMRVSDGVRMSVSNEEAKILAAVASAAGKSGESTVGDIRVKLCPWSE